MNIYLSIFLASQILARRQATIKISPAVTYKVKIRIWNFGKLITMIYLKPIYRSSGWVVTTSAKFSCTAFMQNSVFHPARHSSCGSIPYALAALCNKSHLFISELVLVQILTFPDGSHLAKLLALRNPGAK